MIVEIFGRQDDIVGLIDGDLTGTGLQGIFRISHGAGTENHHEKDQNE